MGLIDRKALKRGQRVLAPYLEPGEVVEDFDVGYIGQTEIDLITTDRTLWFFPSAGGDLVKLPYTDVRSVVWERGRTDAVLGIVTRSGQRYLFEIRAPRGLGPALRDRVPFDPPADPDQPSLWT